MGTFILGAFILVVRLIGLVYWLRTRGWRNEPLAPALFLAAAGIGSVIACVGFIFSPTLILLRLVTF